MLSDIFYDIVSVNNRGCKPIGIIMTDEARLLVMRESQNGEMQRFNDGEERLYGLLVTVSHDLKTNYEILTE